MRRKYLFLYIYDFLSWGFGKTIMKVILKKGRKNSAFGNIFIYIIQNQGTLQVDVTKMSNMVFFSKPLSLIIIILIILSRRKKCRYTFLMRTVDRVCLVLGSEMKVLFMGFLSEYSFCVDLKETSKSPFPEPMKENAVS